MVVEVCRSVTGAFLLSALSCQNYKSENNDKADNQDELWVDAIYELFFSPLALSHEERAQKAIWIIELLV